MLALYTIGTYLQPIIHVFRSSIGDVIMPEIASKKDVPPNVALVLWQRATVVYCVVMMPMAVLLFYYADVFISVLFTSAYAEAIPIFQAFVLLLVHACFDFSLPLRIANRTNRVFLFQLRHGRRQPGIDAGALRISTAFWGRHSRSCCLDILWP